MLLLLLLLPCCSMGLTVMHVAMCRQIFMGTYDNPTSVVQLVAASITSVYYVSQVRHACVSALLLA